MTQIDRNEFGRRVLQEFRGTFLDKGSRLGRETELILVEDVYLDELDPEYPLVVLLRDESQPECLFGYRWPLEPEWSEDPLQDPYFPALIAWANLEESIVGEPGLPRECDPDSITWF